MKRKIQKKRNMKKIKRNQKRKNITNSKQIFRISKKRKIVDSNMNFMNENIFQKKFQIINEKSFFSSFRSLLSVSVNFYEKIPSDVDALNSLNFFELNSQLNFQSISDRRDVLIFRFRIFNLRINFRNQNIQSSSFELSFVINCHRAGLEYIASKNIFIRSQSFFSRSSFFFQSFFSRFSFFDQNSLTASFSIKIKTLSSIALRNFTVKTTFFVASISSEIMSTNSFRRKQLIKIEIFKKNEQTDIKNLYKKRFFDILNIINDVQNQISPSVLRKINKIVKNLKKKKTVMNEAKKNENKTKKNENKIIQI